MRNDVSNSEISQRAFVVGCPRSGTTLLQSMLAGHPRIQSFPETHFFARGFGGRRRWMIHETLRGWYLWYLLVSWLVETDQISLSEAYRIPISWSKRRMVDVFCHVLDQQARSNESDIWIEKTPRHLHFLDVIAEHVPDSKFIHIVRDGRAVVASLHRLAKSHPDKWAAFRSIGAAIDRWNRSVRDTAQRVSEDSDQVVRYEELVEGPATCLRELSTFLEIDYDRRMVERFREEAERMVKPHESWKERAVTSELEHHGLSKFHDEFSKDEQAYIESELDWDRYRSLGYEPL